MSKDDIKKQEEKEQIKSFLNTDIGKAFWGKNDIINIQKSEAPDFLLIKKDKTKLALEVTQFITKNKNTQYSQSLIRYGNNLCNYAKTHYGIQISILINKYDLREFSPNWKDHIDYVYNPGFSKIPSKDALNKELKNILAKNIDSLKNGKQIQKWIQIENDYFNISIDPYICPWTNKYNCMVNNAGKVTIDPIEQLQICIDKKNSKIAKYKTDCVDGYLLIYIPSSRQGNYYSFSKNMFKHHFNSEFDAIFLFEETTKISYILS